MYSSFLCIIEYIFQFKLIFDFVTKNVKKISPEGDAAWNEKS